MTHLKLILGLFAAIALPLHLHAKVNPQEKTKIEDKIKSDGALGTYLESSYIQMLPTIRTEMGDAGASTLSKLNECYRELKKQGNQDPKISEVYALYAKKFPQTAFGAPEILLVCGIAATGAIGIGGIALTIIWSRMEQYNSDVNALRREQNRQNDCDKRASVILEKSKIQSASLVPSASGSR